MRVVLFFISLCFVTVFAWAGSTDYEYDHYSDHNYEAFEDQWQQKTNHTDTAAPSDSSGLPSEGKVIDWYSGGYGGGYGGDSFDDSFKPRPYFGAESLFDLYLPDLEERLLELVNYIHGLLEYPFRELKQILLLLSLKELDALQALRQPGTQQDTAQVPGIFMAPTLVSGSSGKTGSGETSTGGGGGASGGDTSQNTEQSSAGKSGGAGEGSGGDGEKPPASNQHSGSDNGQEQTGLKVTRQFTVDFRKFFELNGVLDSDNADLYCSCCKNLVSEKGAQCQQCQSYLCFSHVESAEGTGTAECPDCQKDSTFTQVDLSPRINELVWECPRLCGRLYTAKAMKYHLRQNRCSQLYRCYYDSCGVVGTYGAVWEHEQGCNWGQLNQLSALTLGGIESTKNAEDSEPAPSEVPALKCCSQCQTQMTAEALPLHQSICAPTIQYENYKLTFISATPPCLAYQMIDKMSLSFVQVLLPVSTCFEEGQHALGTFRLDLYWGIETLFVTYRYVEGSRCGKLIISIFEKDDPPSRMGQYAMGVSLRPFIPDGHRLLWNNRWHFDPKDWQHRPEELDFKYGASGEREIEWANWEIRRFPKKGWFGITIVIDSCFVHCVGPPPLPGEKPL